MRIFLYEYITGGGLLGDSDAALRSLEPEGRAMLLAAAHDFVALNSATVMTVRDARLTGLSIPCCKVFDVRSPAEEREAIERLCASADWTLLIAPEIDNALQTRTQWAERAGGRLLSPASDFVALASDKLASNARLAEAGVPVMKSGMLEVPTRGDVILPSDVDYPVVIKRTDGAGSLGMQRHDTPKRMTLDPNKPWMVEQFCPGLSIGVAMLCGLAGCYPLPPFVQRFEPGSFSYRGGARLVEEKHIQRAQELAVRAVETMGRPTGFVGVDMILRGVGNEKAGAETTSNIVIEINPRLTTSYIGLRQIAHNNLAAAMLDAAAGRVVELSFGEEFVEFEV